MTIWMAGWMVAAPGASGGGELSRVRDAAAAETALSQLCSGEAKLGRGWMLADHELWPDARRRRAPGSTSS